MTEEHHRVKEVIWAFKVMWSGGQHMEISTHMEYQTDLMK